MDCDEKQFREWRARQQTASKLARTVALWTAALALLTVIAYAVVEAQLESLAFALLLALALLLVVGGIPGYVARRRQHRNTLAITVCGYAGVLTFGVLWIVALIWACTNPAAERR